MKRPSTCAAAAAAAAAAQGRDTDRGRQGVTKCLHASLRAWRRLAETSGIQPRNGRFESLELHFVELDWCEVVVVFQEHQVLEPYDAGLHEDDEDDEDAHSPSWAVVLH